MTTVAILLMVIMSGWGSFAVGPTGFSGTLQAPHTSKAPLVHSQAVVSPLGANGPYFSYFSAYPASGALGTNFSLTSYVYGGTAPYNYTYLNLPLGCKTANQSYLHCKPTVSGQFKIELLAIDSSVNKSYAADNVSILVYGAQVAPFYQVSQGYSAVAVPNQPCAITNASPFYTAYCQNVQYSPNVLAFANGTVGIISTASTDSTSNSCPGAATTTNSRLQELLSTDSGVTFVQQATTLGGSACGQQNAIEPSFSVSSTGVAYGVFVMENYSGAPGTYSSRAGDSIGFITSTDNGTKWSAATVISASGNIARPVLAVDGKSIYVVYEDIQNSSAPIPGGALPISVQFMASLDGGSTWSSPVTMPGWNATQGYNAMSPSVAVNGSGKVAVVYATNRSCVNTVIVVGCVAWGESIAVFTSTNNGSTWSQSGWAATGVGESTCSLGTCDSSFYQSTPDLSATFDQNGSLYVAYSGTMDQKSLAGTTHNYRQSGVSIAFLARGSTVWTSEPLVVPAFGTDLNASNPTLAASSKSVYVAYTEQNGTSGSSNFAESYSEWIGEVPAGTTLPTIVPRPIDMITMPTGLVTNATQGTFFGYSASIAINITGGPMVGYTFPSPVAQSVASSPTYYYVNYTYTASVSLAENTWVGSPLSTPLLFLVFGGTPNMTWQVNLEGVAINSTAVGLEVLDVPTGVPLVSALVSSTKPAYGVVDMAAPSISIPSPYVVYPSTIAQTVSLSYSFSYLVELGFSPNLLPTHGNYGEAYWLGSASPNYATCGNNCWYVYQVEALRYSDYVSASYGSLYEWENYEYASIGNWYAYCVNYSIQIQYNYCGSYLYPYSTSQVNPLAHAPSPQEVPFQIYMPAGATYSPYMYTYGGTTISSINGTGSGSFTGTPSGGAGYYYMPSIIVNGPINETANVGGVASISTTYNETVKAHGLPSGTKYHFTWNGTAYNGTTPNATYVLNQSAGGYTVSNVWAPGASTGWEYFGAVSPAGQVVVPYQPGVNLSYTAYEDVAQPLQTISFHAKGLETGTLWDLEFNGTTYATTTPWENISVHPGIYDAGTSVGASATGTTSYRAASFGPTINISSGEVEINITFSPTYRILVTAATGGTVQETGQNTSSQSLTVWAAPGAQESFVANATPGWSFLGWTGTGAGSYTGNLTTAIVTANGVISETASFSPFPDARFNLTFIESGLPAGTWWTVNLNGVGYSSNQSEMVVGNLYSWVSGSVGRYALSIPYAYLNSTSQTRFFELGAPGLVGTNGTLTPPVLVTYQTEQLTTVESSFGGTALLSVGGVASGQTVWGATGADFQLSEVASPGYTFTGWMGTGSGAYTGSNTSATITVTTTPILEYAEFSAIPPTPTVYYVLNLTLTTSLEAGTVWSLQIHSATGGPTQNYSTTSSYLRISGLQAGTYGISFKNASAPDGLVRYAPSSTIAPSVKIAGNSSLSVGFVSSYFVSVQASIGGRVHPSSGWEAVGTPLSLLAVPDSAAGYTFLGWVGTGSGSYTGTSPTPEITVNGPITEIAQFIPPAPVATKVTTSSGSIWQSSLTLVALGIVGLIIGLAVGLLIFRRNRGGGQPPRGTASESTRKGEGSREGSEVAGSPTAASYSEENEPQVGGVQ